ncbi:MAG: nicotinate (nicotinamide) nucleotide adenylyltransferase [Acidobacteria bacterium]|nr:nicotinate (nicotinamide) nucleotide adenylyltransferase [Acidobacteriota bacterium]
MQGEDFRGRRKIGLFGGTFDPPHVGHLAAARAAVEGFDLEAVRFVVAGDPWQKTRFEAVTEARHRQEMTQLAIEGVPDFQVDDLEVRRRGPSYTADTLEELASQEPEVDWYLVIGSDSAAGLDTWERREIVAELATIVVVARPGSEQAVVQEGWELRTVTSPLVDLSSSQLRNQIKLGRSVRWLVPDPVIAYVAEVGLYGGGE